METAAAPCISLSLHAAHTQLPKRHARDYAFPLTHRANRQPPPSSAVLSCSFPHACALNCPLPLARLPTTANDPCASLQSGSFRAGLPYNYLLTLAQLPTATLPPVRLRGVGVPYTGTRVSWGLVGAAPEHTLYYFFQAPPAMRRAPCSYQAQAQ